MNLKLFWKFDARFETRSSGGRGMRTLCYFCSSSRLSTAVDLLLQEGRNRDTKTNQKATRARIVPAIEM